MFNKLMLEDLSLDGKKVFIRVDFNVPLNEKLEITYDLRIQQALKSIKYLIDQNAAVIIASHLGRPKGKVVPEMSLKPVAEHLSGLLGKKVIMAPDCVGEETETLAKNLKPGDVLLLENLRFHKGETDNDPEFAGQLASLADLYVNDAFGTAHRAHASTVGITKYFDQVAAGYLLQTEIEYLGNTLNNPEKPFIAILGGAKVSSKIGVIENLLDKCDTILLGGAMVYTFMKSEGMETGASLVEEDKMEEARRIRKSAEENNTELVLPADHVISTDIKGTGEIKTVDNETEWPEGWMGVDIGPKTASHYSEVIAKAKTIVWNGPMGVFEVPEFSDGTNAVTKAVAESDALSIIGGGDSSAAVKAAGLASSITHVSTGGGASLDFLSGKDLPGVSALTDKKD